MKPESQRVAISEACGWRVWQNHGCAGGYGATDPDGNRGQLLGGTPAGAISMNAPDYLSDLNAMHAAEKMLTKEQVVVFMRELLNAIWKPEIKQIEAPEGGWWKITTFESGRLISATAAQRAEALLRTLNLWDDAK